MKKLFDFKMEDLQAMQIVDWAYSEDLTPKTYVHFKNWVSQDGHGPLSYLSDHRADIRKDIKSFFPEAKSSLCFLFDYRNARVSKSGKNKIASYVTGFDDQDYHHWIGEKLNVIGDKILSLKHATEFKISLDIHPVLERDVAYRSGLGWFGKNSMLINQKLGSFQLIGTIFLDNTISLKSSPIVSDHCGNCTACIDACPTEAINGDKRSVDASKCISTFTIEIFKEVEPPKGYPTISNEIFGCDICQDVCPWNRKPLKEISPDKKSKWDIFFDREATEIIKELEQMSNKGFKKFFSGTSFERLGKKGLLKNLKYYVE